VRIVTVTGPEGSMDYKIIAPTVKILPKNGDSIDAGDPITAGSIYPQDILRTKTVVGLEESMIREVQSAYRVNGVQINDKHIEVVVRQMLRKVRVTEQPNDTDFITNELVDINHFQEENEKVVEEGGRPAHCKRVLLGISKAALATDSFLSAASFQETTKVLADAAIRGKVDHFVGLKENVLIGKLIPAGTGMKIYRNNVAVEKVADAGRAAMRKEEEIPLFDEGEDIDS